MAFHDDPEEMTPEQRLREVASILAAGCLRLRASPQPALGPDSPNSFTDKELDVSGHPRPPVDNGLTARDPVSSSPEVVPFSTV
jgi:hypothetical protein